MNKIRDSLLPRDDELLKAIGEVHLASLQIHSVADRYAKQEKAAMQKLRDEYDEAIANAEEGDKVELASDFAISTRDYYIRSVALLERDLEEPSERLEVTIEEVMHRLDQYSELHKELVPVP